MKYSNIGSAMSKNLGSRGLRGDSYLYFEIEEALHDRTIPDESEFESVMYSAFEKFSGVSIESTEYRHIERHSHGGMSSGMIAPEIWKSEIIPHLKEIIYGGNI
ncbi:MULTISPECIES: hypothetical protein [Pseudoalteromonas]|uniref:hypothetical protein n=1 Tax=Pseudoalteromonas TaxID=53246 RepID=UPI003001A3FD